MGKEMKLSAVIYNLCYKMSHVYELECKMVKLCTKQDVAPHIYFLFTERLTNERVVVFLYINKTYLALGQGRFKDYRNGVENQRLP